MRSYEDLPKTVQAMGKLNLTGNLIPTLWFQNLKFKSGRPHLPAILILSDICYWYRPTEIRDEETGQVSDYKKKFKADKLQRSRASFSEQFGFTIKQVRDALSYLKKQKLITLDYRQFSVGGQVLSNVLFIDVITERIEKITTEIVGPDFWEEDSEPELPESPDESPVGPDPLPTGHEGRPVSPTYTENPTEITPEIRNKEEDGGLNRPAEISFREISACLEVEEVQGTIVYQGDESAENLNNPLNTSFQSEVKNVKEEIKTIGFSIPTTPVTNPQLERNRELKKEYEASKLRDSSQNPKSPPRSGFKSEWWSQIARLEDWQGGCVIWQRSLDYDLSRKPDDVKLQEEARKNQEFIDAYDKRIAELSDGGES